MCTCVTQAAKASVTIVLTENAGNVDIYCAGGSLDLTYGFVYNEAHTDNSYYDGYIKGVLLGLDCDFRTESGSGITLSESSGWTDATDTDPYACPTYTVSSPSPAGWVVGINTLYMGGCIIVSRDYQLTGTTEVITVPEFTGTLSGVTFDSMGLTGNEWFRATWDTASSTDYLAFTTVSVPEPATTASLLGLGSMGLIALRRRFRIKD